jgi:hypothetical protein
MASKPEKLSLTQVRKLPYKTLNRMLKKMRERLKQDEVVQKMFKEYEVDISEIDLIPMKFGKIDVSAKTDHGVLIFNYKLLCDGDFLQDYSYGVHEITHWLQQTTGTKPTQSADDGDYLHNKFEQEGFQNQVEYIANNEGKEEAEEYVDDLLEHHDKDGKEADKLKDVLLSKASRSPELKKKMRELRMEMVKYHPDNKETGDTIKYLSLAEEMNKLKAEEPFEAPKSSPRRHPWGDWYDKR